MNDFKHLLGEMTDTEISLQFNCSREYVRKCRIKLNIPKYEYQYGRTWTQDELDMLGKMSDVEVSKILNVSRLSVTQKRNKLNIPKFKLVESKWTDKSLSMLGKISDKQLGEKFKIHKDNVAQKRKSLNISPFREHTRWNPCVKWTKDLDDLLGKDTDTNIAKSLGVNGQIVYQRRKKLGIPKFNKLNTR